MKDLDQRTDEKISEDWQSLESILLQEIEPQPNEVISKQIIAAAHREIKKKKKPKGYQTTWWKKLSLPLYITAGFTFSVFSFKYIWPVQDIRNGQEITTEASVEIDISLSIDVLNDSNQNQPQRKLPLLVIAPKNHVATEKEPVIVMPNQTRTNQRLEKVEEIYTGSHLFKALYPEKDAWARKIIELIQNGDEIIARQELIRFKNVYPDYPIEEQIKVLTR